MADFDIDALLADLAHSEWRTRQGALRAIGMRGYWEPRIAEALARCLGDSHKDVRYMAAWSTGRLGAKASELVEKLGPLLEDEDAQVARKGVEAIAQIGVANPEIVETLFRILEHEGHGRWAPAQTALLGLHAKGRTPAIAERVQVLAELLRSEDSEEQRRGLQVLWRLGDLGLGFFDDLIRLAKSPDPLTRRAAISGMYKYGADAVAGLDVLMAAAEGEDKAVRDAALSTMAHIGVGAKAVLPVFVAALDVAETRKVGLMGLASLGAEAVSAVPRLLEVLAEPVPETEDTSRHWYARADVAKTMAAIGDPRAIPGLADWVPERAEDATFGEQIAYIDFRRFVMEAIASFGPTARSVGAALAVWRDHEMYDETVADVLQAIGWDEEA